MREYQHEHLTREVAALLAEGAATPAVLDARRILWGATPDELGQILDGLGQGGMEVTDALS